MNAINTTVDNSQVFLDPNKLQENKNEIIKQLLAYIIKNPEKYSEFPSINKVLENEDYVLYFYIKNGVQNGITIDKNVLEISLQHNASRWLDRRSILFKDAKSRIDNNYIQSRIENQLVTDNDFKEGFTAIVLDRYNQLLDTYVEIDFESDIVKDLIVKLIESDMGEDLIRECIELLNKDKRYKGIVYDSNSVIPYIRTRLNELDIELGISSKFDNYLEYIQDRYIDNITRQTQCFNWNLGKLVKMPNVYKGYMVSLIGQEKAGKTRFVAGEMVYPTLLQGRNVLFYSSEMEETQMISILVSKHIYNKEKLKISSQQIDVCIGVEGALEKYGITIEEYDKQLEMYSKLMRKDITINEYKHIIDEDIFKRLYNMRETIEEYKKLTGAKKEIIKMYMFDLINNESIGNIHVLTFDEGIFNVDDMIPKTRELIKKYDISLVVYDHAGYAYSNTQATKTEIMTRLYQDAKNIAKSKDNPVTFVVVNHIKTTTSESIGKSGYKEGVVISAHNTSEAKKSADIEIALYRTAELDREGAINLQVLAVRNGSFYKDPIALFTDYMVSDYVIMGGTKDRYETILEK